jgi:hypothetical protein
MNRRQALLSIATATTVAVAGCLGTDGSTTTTTADENGDTTTSAENTSPDSTTTGTAQTAALPEPPFEGMSADPAETYVVGEQAGTAKATPGVHVVQMWNDSDETREVTVVITGAKTGTQFDETVEIDAGEHLNFEFERPDEYTVDVSGDGFSTTASVERDWNECSTSMSTMRLQGDGTEMRSTSRSRTCN